MEEGSLLGEKNQENLDSMQSTSIFLNHFRTSLCCPEGKQGGRPRRGDGLSIWRPAGSWDDLCDTHSSATAFMAVNTSFNH